MNDKTIYLASVEYELGGSEAEYSHGEVDLSYAKEINMKFEPDCLPDVPRLRNFPRLRVLVLSGDVCDLGRREIDDAIDNETLICPTLERVSVYN